MSDNPYAPPAVDVVSAPESSDESTRKYYIRHETSVKSIATLNYLGVLAFGGLTLIGIRNWQNDGEIIGTVTIMAILTVANLIAGINIKRLNTTGRVLNGILFTIGLLGFPIGTIFSIFVLVALFGAKGKMIFSQDYQEIIARTPHIKYRTSKTAWVILIVFLLFIALGIALLASR